MSENKYFVYDSVTINPAMVDRYEHKVFGPVTAFKNVVIAREIVHQYDDGMAYKPAKELEERFWTAEGRWAKAGAHPDTTVIASIDDINGRTINARFTKSLNDPKTRRPNNRGVTADLEVFDRKIAPDVLEDMLSGRKTDVSIGFFFDKDDTPGTIEEDGHPLNGTQYDYVQRNFMIDHTAFALETGMGRCPLPFCGIGADKKEKEEVKMKVSSSYENESGKDDNIIGDFLDDYYMALRRYDALQHLSSIYTCYTAIQQKHVLPQEQQYNTKNAFSQVSPPSSQTDSTEIVKHNSWNNIFAVLTEGAQNYDCKICKQILLFYNDDGSFPSDVVNSKDLHNWLNKSASLVYDQMDKKELPFHTEDIVQAHAQLLQIAQDYPFSSYQYIKKDKNIYTLRRELGLDPFGKWESFEECIKDIMKENPSYTREQAAGTCAEIEKKSKAKHKKDEMLKSDVEEEGNMQCLKVWKKKLDELIAQFDGLVEEEYQGNASNTTLSERAKRFFNLSDDQWNELTEAEKEDYISKLPPEKPVEGTTNKDTWTITKDEFNELPLEKKLIFLDLMDCKDCEDDWEIDADLQWYEELLGEDALTYAQKKALPDSAYAYIEPGCKKEDGKTQQSCRHMPIHDEPHVRAAIQALGGARTGKVPSYASKAKGKICAAAKKFKIESEVCGTKKKKKDTLPPTDELLREVEELGYRIN